MNRCTARVVVFSVCPLMLLTWTMTGTFYCFRGLVDDEMRQQSDPIYTSIGSFTASSKEKKTLLSQQTVETETHRLMIPNVLIVGAQKAGTTFISSWLRHFSEEDVCTPKPVPGGTHHGDLDPFEVHFFNKDERFEQGIDVYGSRWEHCGNTTYRLDKTPGYLGQADRIRQFYEQQGTAAELKIIVSLREPVAREISHYRMVACMIKNKEVNPDVIDWAQKKLQKLGGRGEMWTFEEYVNRNNLTSLTAKSSPRRTGFYSIHLKEWIEAFDRKQILVLSYEELESNPEAYVGRIHAFLGLRGEVRLREETKGTKKRTKSYPPCSVQERLAKVFEPYNEDLLDLLANNPGPEVEQRPFPKLTFACVGNTTEGFVQ